MKAAELIADLQKLVAERPDLEIYLHDGDVHVKPETCDLQCEEWQADVNVGTPFAGACDEFAEFTPGEEMCANCDHDRACHKNAGGAL